MFFVMKVCKRKMKLKTTSFLFYSSHLFFVSRGLYNPIDDSSHRHVLFHDDFHSLGDGPNPATVTILERPHLLSSFHHLVSSCPATRIHFINLKPHHLIPPLGDGPNPATVTILERPHLLSSFHHLVSSCPATRIHFINLKPHHLIPPSLIKQLS